jgi:hypothetical protein
MNKRLISLTVPLLIPLAAPGSESANYSITPQSQTSGGLSTSVNYTLNSSTEAAGATASAAYSVRGGFAGSLYDPVALELTATPLTVNEGGTLPLGASLLLDDATRLMLAPSAVAWSVAGGPLSSISAAGLATAGSVYQTTGATARGDYLTFTDTLALNVLNVGDDDYQLYAGDGIADDWQVLYFGENNANAAPLLDPDNDGWTNLFEYRAGLVPSDPFSVFSLRMEPVPGQAAQRRIIFSPRLPGRTYTVMSSLTLQPGSWAPLAGATVSDNGDERTVTDPNAGGPRKLYRVDVTRP